MKFIRNTAKGIGKVIKPLVNFPAWMGWQQIQSSSKTIADAAKTLAEQPKAKRKETFEQAVARLRLTEKDLQQRMKTFKTIGLFYAIIAVALLSYVIYMLVGGHIAAAFLSLILTILASSLSLRQYFWRYQIKRRKLGCSLKEWFNDTFRGASR